MRIIINVLLVLAFLTYSCNETFTEKNIVYADNLKNAIDSFENSRKNVADNVAEATEETTKSLSNENPNISQVAIDWEKEWKDIIKQFNQLEKNFSLVGNSSNEYFLKLDELCNSIENENIKDSEIQKNKVLKEKYTEAYLDAASNIEKIRQILKEGGDYHKVLIASSMRQKINENIDELKQISSNAKRILSDLEKFTIEGKKLITAS